jgi:hypothetical protein
MIYWGGALPVERIHTFLVHPGKGSKASPETGGTTVPLSGKLFRLLDNIYSKSESECDIEIAFNHAADGKATNECRSLITAYLAKPSITNARRIGERLYSLTDKRSGLGLLFLITGMEGAEHKIVISRFPTDSAILAEEKKSGLTVEFLERVFMKSATSYKAVAYQHRSLESGFWLGNAVDKQINSSVAELSAYWIFDFLDSSFRITPAAGTRRLGAALRNAARSVGDVVIKSEIAAAVTLAGSFAGRKTSISEFAESLGLSPEARAAIVQQLKNPETANEQFRFDAAEFKSQVAFRSVQLDNGGFLTAESGEFEDVFKREVLNPKTHEVQFSTRGKVINEKLRKAHE